MPKRYPRRYRVAALIREELAAALAADRRAGLVALREVKLSADCSQAKIYYTLIQSDSGGDEKSARARAAEFFEENSKRLRTRLARSAQMRATPTLTFIYDDESLQAEKLTRLLDSLAP